jgi:flagellar secretion chaperone FliS
VTSPAALAAARNRYTGNAIATASGPALLVMLYDRLVRDLVQAEQALRDRDLARVNSELQHAQQIVLELRSSLDTTAWSGAPALEQLYTFVHTELVSANVEKSASRIVSCRVLIEPLRDAWRQAATGAAAS